MEGVSRLPEIAFDSYKPMVYNDDMTPQELQKWREQNNYSQSQLADALTVATQTISRWERGVREIPSFLHITLKCLKKRNGGESKKGMKKRKEKT